MPGLLQRAQQTAHYTHRRIGNVITRGLAQPDGDAIYLSALGKLRKGQAQELASTAQLRTGKLHKRTCALIWLVALLRQPDKVLSASVALLVVIKNAMPRRTRAPAHYPSKAVAGLRPGDNAWMIGHWAAEEREAQDARFVAAMQAAGYELTAPSTVAGTRCPISNYQRD